MPWRNYAHSDICNIKAIIDGESLLIKQITLLGHKDHGKSTLIGNLLILSRTVTEDRINEAKRISQELGKPFEPGFILDSFSEEREGGLTIDTTRAQLLYKDAAFEFIDVPGHEELIKNMISGASNAQLGLLMISAKPNEGIQDQTKRHVFLARMLGIDTLIVAVNKIDTVNYSETEYRKITREMGWFFKAVGYEKRRIKFVPISAYNGDNLLGLSKNTPWYSGEPLAELLYRLATKKARGRFTSLRVLGQGVIETGKGESLVAGKVLSGRLARDSTIDLAPYGDSYVVKKIMVKGRSVKKAKTDDDVALRLDRPVEKERLRGSVFCAPEEKPEVSNRIRAEIFLADSLAQNTSIKFNGAEIACKSLNVIEDIDTTTGKRTTGAKPRALEAILAELELDRKVPTEKYSDLRALGRFVVFSDSRFVGMGIIV